ncbi:MAG: hypothetical protein AAF492_18375, partial [Verrucomicrobiota bacterium]
WASTTESFKTLTPASPQLNVTDGLALWLDASDPATVIASSDPGFVERWLDKSGRGNDMIQSATANKPATGADVLNGLNVLTFDGNNVLAGPPFLAGGDDTYTMIAVWRPHANRTQVIFEQSQTPQTVGTRASMLQTGADYGYNGQNNDSHDLVVCPPNEWRSSIMMLNGAPANNVRLWDNGRENYGTIDIVTADVGTSATRIGNKLTSNGEWFDGDMAEILAFDRDLSEAEVQEVGAYLEQKYQFGAAYPEGGVVARVDVVSLPPPGVTTNSAVMNGHLFSRGAVHDVTLFYGTTDGGTNVSAWSHAVGLGWWTNAETSISRSIGGLAPTTTYYYTFRMTNCVDTVWARPPTVFNTLFAPGLPAWSGKFTFCGYARNELLANFPVLIQLSTNIPGFDYAVFSPGGLDLRFLDAGGSVELNYEIESWDTNGISHVWVQLPALADSNTCIIGYGGLPGLAAPIYTTNGSVWSEDYLAVWHLHDTNTAGVFFDSTANGRDGTNNGSVNAPGLVADAQQFDGVSAFIDSGQSFLNNLGAFTLSTWANGNLTPAGVDG